MRILIESQMGLFYAQYLIGDDFLLSLSRFGSHGGRGIAIMDSQPNSGGNECEYG